LLGTKQADNCWKGLFAGKVCERGRLPQRKVYVNKRMTKPLTEWFTMTDDAFQLLGVIRFEVEPDMGSAFSTSSTNTTAARTTRRAK
jgi:hypothetical protein